MAAETPTLCVILHEGEFEQIIKKIRLSIKDNNNCKASFIDL